VEEVLYPAMEDFALDLVMGKGPGAKSLRLNLPKFTLIGATTRYALLSAPLRDRFGAVYRLDFYDETSIQTILKRSARILGVDVDAPGLEEIARRSRGTPRVANRLLRRVRDYAQVRANAQPAHCGHQALLCWRSTIGLDEIDHTTAHDHRPFTADRWGWKRCTSISEADTIMDVYEPYLLQFTDLRMSVLQTRWHLSMPKKDARRWPRLNGAVEWAGRSRVGRKRVNAFSRSVGEALLSSSFDRAGCCFRSTASGHRHVTV
jgi:Holliday junction resolvasome RuvABC ATP-dependent DNA helicase subunit